MTVRMPIVWPVMLAVVLLLTGRAWAQGATAGEVLTNELVVQMVVGKVPKNIILGKIRSQSNTFDNTPEALVALYKAKLSNDVIQAMMDVSVRTDSKEVLTNDNVIYMVTNGLPKSLILRKIRETKPKFDLTTPGTISLVQNKIPKDIQDAMWAAAPPGQSAPVVSSSNSVVPSNSPGARTPTAAAPPPASTARSTGSAPAPSPLKLKDGEAATFQTALSSAAATAKVKAYLDAKNIDFTVNADTGRITSDWFNERRCGPGIQHCANRASVRVSTDNGHTVVTVQVFERKREGGLSEKPWHESSTSKGKETAEFAAELEASLRGSR